MKTLTQEQVDQGDAFGLVAGTDYEIVMPENMEDDLDDDMGEMDVDLNGTGAPQLEGDSDGGKSKDSDSQEDDDESTDKGEKDAAEEDDAGDADADAEPDTADADNADDNAAADAAADTAADAKDDGPKLPKFRYDQQKAKADRLAQENAKLQADLAAARAAPAPAPAKEDTVAEPTREQTLLEEKLDDLILKKNEALIDSDAKAAAKFERELIVVQGHLARLTAEPAPKAQELDIEQVRAETRAALKAEQEMDSALDNLEAEYDMLNEKHEAFDAKVVERVLRLQRLSIEDGLSPVEALIEAAETVLAGVETNTAKVAAKTSDVAKRKTNVKKNLAAAKKQPANLSDDVGDDSDSAGLNNDLPDIDKLSDAEFDALPAHTQDRMMGNVVH